MSTAAFEGLRALVTGAGRGIGRELAATLAGGGAEVVVAARTQTELEETAAQIRAAGGRAEVCVCDVSDPGSVTAAAHQVGRVDIVVNNAGDDQPTPFFDVTPELFARLVAANLTSVFLVSQAFARLMTEAGTGGSIVNISSQLALVGAPWETAYCAAKFGVEGLTRSMALELAAHGIRVNSVAPTVVETGRTAVALADPSLRAMIVGRIPLGRLATPPDVAAAVAYLASPAAGMVTGTCLPVDGGWTAQ